MNASACVRTKSKFTFDVLKDYKPKKKGQTPQNVITRTLKKGFVGPNILVFNDLKS